MPADAEAARDFARETLVRCAGSVAPWEHGGVILRTPELDRVWALNAAVALRSVARLTFPEVDALLAERFAGGKHASLVFVEEPGTEGLTAAARERGWRVEREVFMALRRAPDRRVDTSGVREGGWDEIEPLMRRWNEEELADQGPEALRQLMVFAEREWRARPTRALVSDDALATTRVWSEGGVAQVEAVFTAPEARGRGLARALLTRALEIAREDDPRLIFIVADADDTPQQLYARLGFDPIVHQTRLVRAAP